MARASVLAPLQYSAILWAAILGWLIWRDAPTPSIVLGNAIIIGSGLYAATRSKRGEGRPSDQALLRRAERLDPISPT